MTFLLLVLLCNSVALHFELGDLSPIVFSTDFTIGEVPFYQVLHEAATGTTFQEPPSAKFRREIDQLSLKCR